MKVTCQCEECGCFIGGYALFCKKCGSFKVKDVSCRHCVHFNCECPNNIFGKNDSGNSCSYFSDSFIRSKKYELVVLPGEHKKPFKRIKALYFFKDVKAGDIGGFVESEDNLSQEGNCWIYDEAKAIGDSRVKDNAEIRDYCSIEDNSIVGGDMILEDFVRLTGKTHFKDEGILKNNEHYHNNKLLKRETETNRIAQKKIDQYLNVKYKRPKKRCDCANIPRPCPYIGCKFNLYLDVNDKTGSIIYNFPNREPYEMDESCVLDIVDNNKGSVTLGKVGEYLNLTRERARQIEFMILEKMRKQGEDKKYNDELEL